LDGVERGKLFVVTNSLPPTAQREVFRWQNFIVELFHSAHFCVQTMATESLTFNVFHRLQERGSSPRFERRHIQDYVSSNVL
jgi:hypothetical protein